MAFEQEASFSLRGRLYFPGPVARTAIEIYSRRDELRTRHNRQVLVFASLYAACRLEGYPVTIQEITELARVPEWTIGGLYREIVTELNLRVPAPDLSAYLDRLATSLGLFEEEKERASALLDRVVARRLCQGNDPMSLAAAVIVAACANRDGRGKRHVERVCMAANRTPAAVRAIRKIILPVLGTRESIERFRVR